MDLFSSHTFCFLLVSLFLHWYCHFHHMTRLQQLRYQFRGKLLLFWFSCNRKINFPGSKTRYFSVEVLHMELDLLIRIQNYMLTSSASCDTNCCVINELYCITKTQLKPSCSEIPSWVFTGLIVVGDSVIMWMCNSHITVITPTQARWKKTEIKV